MAIYHFHASKGQQGKHSAKAKFDYIGREGKYQNDNAELVGIGSANMPEWTTSPKEYWATADKFERENGRLYRQYEIALPRELKIEEQTELVQSFCKDISTLKEGKLPYSYAIHKGHDDNPHFHLMVSERVNDGRERSRETWFKRANKKDLFLGGAVKTEVLEKKDKLLELREKWADMANKALEQAGHNSRIDHRTLEKQGLNHEPKPYMSLAVLQMEEKGIRTEKGTKYMEAIERDERSRETETSKRDPRISGNDRAISPEHGTVDRGFKDKYEQATRADERTYTADDTNTINGYRSDKRADESDRASKASQYRGQEQNKTSFMDNLLKSGNICHNNVDSSAIRILHLAEPLKRTKTESQELGYISGDIREHARPSQNGDKKAFRVGVDRTYEAVNNQLRAMNCYRYEIGIRDVESGKMMNREYTAEQVLKSIPQLKRMNARGNDIYIRPSKAENRALVLVDDIDTVTIENMAEKGVNACCVVETSHKNLQAWVDLGKSPLPEEERKLLAQTFAKDFDADAGSADSRHYGRLAGFTNRKEKYLTYKGYPYVLCRDSRGEIARNGEELRNTVKNEVERLRELSKRHNEIEKAKVSFYAKKDVEGAYKAFMREYLEHCKKSDKKVDLSKADYAVSCRLLIAGCNPDEVVSSIERNSPEIYARKGIHAKEYAERTVSNAGKNAEVQEKMAKERESRERIKDRGRGMSL